MTVRRGARPGDRDHELGSVFRLVYRSRTRIAPDQREPELEDIFGTAFLQNARLRVTGALLVWGDAFVQVLEGDEPAVRDIFATLRDDTRHEDVELLDADTVPGRVFGRWSMARVGDGGGDDLPVRAGHDTVADPPAAVATGEPGRDTMLGLMCEYARPDVATL